MARGFFDDSDVALLQGQEVQGEKFDPVERSIHFIERVEMVTSEIQLLQNDVKEIWNEARDYGLDVDVLRTVIKRRKKSKATLEQHDIAVGELELRMDGRDIDGEEIDTSDQFDI